MNLPKALTYLLSLKTYNAEDIYHHLHYTDEETETWRGNDSLKVTCAELKPRSKLLAIQQAFPELSMHPHP